MSMRRRVLTALLIAAASGCASQNQVDVYLTNLAPMPSTLFEQRVRLDLRFQNLTETPIEATGLDVALRVNDQRLARGVDARSFTIPRLGEAQASVVVSSGVFDTIKQILGIRDRQVFTYTLQGKVITAGVDKRFRQHGEISRAELQPLAGNQ